MNTKHQREILSALDFERQTILYPGVTRFSDKGVLRDVAADGKSAEIVYTSCAADEIAQVIDEQIQIAENSAYELEWKVYGHDQPPSLGEHLAAAGFEADAKEAFMVFRATPESVAQFGPGQSEIRRITSRDGLKDYQTIVEEVRGEHCGQEIAQYAFLLENHPSNLSVYVAYAEGVPAACGRVYFHENSRFAGLYGGNTRERFRKRGFFTDIVAVRLREAFGRGIGMVCVDALPTSEPILRKHGFERVTDTRPWLWKG